MWNSDDYIFSIVPASYPKIGYCIEYKGNHLITLNTKSECEQWVSIYQTLSEEIKKGE